MRVQTAFAAMCFALCVVQASPAFAFSDPSFEQGSTRPDWAVKPMSDQTDHVYPEFANDLGVGGHVTLRCRINSRGLVERCAIQEETPSGLKFGCAAIRLTALFRFRPAMTLTGAVPSTVNIPIRFVPPPDDLRRAIPFMALLASFTTAIAWYRRRSEVRNLVPPGLVENA